MILEKFHLQKETGGTAGPSLDRLKFGTILWLTLLRPEAIDLATFCERGPPFAKGFFGDVGVKVMPMLLVKTRRIPWNWIELGVQYQHVPKDDSSHKI